MISLNWLKKHYKVYIFTVRACEEESIAHGNDVYKQINDVKEWLRKYQIPYDDITGNKLAAEFYIDDRGIRFEGNWTDTLATIQELMRESK